MSETLSKQFLAPRRYDHIPKLPIPQSDETKVWEAFLNKINKTMEQDMKNCTYKIYDHRRHRVFTGNYLFFMMIKSDKDVVRLRKVVKSWAVVLPLDEAQRIWLEIYNEAVTGGEW